MESERKKVDKNVELDLGELFLALWKKAWIIVVVTILVGALVGSYALFFVTPKYKAKAMMYVNNNSVSVGGTSFNLSDLTAAKSLVNTYMVILNSRNVLNDVIEQSGVGYSYNELSKMISAAPVNSTEVFEVVVTSTDPEEAEKIANCICSVLPEKIASIVESSSVRIVDYAVVPSQKSSPNVTMYAIIGMIVGFIGSCTVLIIMKLFDQSIRSEEYLISNFKYPVLAVIPDLDDDRQKGKYYYYSRRRSDDTDAK